MAEGLQSNLLLSSGTLLFLSLILYNVWPFHETHMYCSMLVRIIELTHHYINGREKEKCYLNE